MLGSTCTGCRANSSVFAAALVLACSNAADTSMLRPYVNISFGNVGPRASEVVIAIVSVLQGGLYCSTVLYCKLGADRKRPCSKKKASQNLFFPFYQLASTLPAL